MFTQRGKSGDDDGKTKDENQNPDETLTISHAIIVDKKDTILVTISYLRRQSSKRM